MKGAVGFGGLAFPDRSPTCAMGHDMTTISTLEISGSKGKLEDFRGILRIMRHGSARVSVK